MLLGGSLGPLTLGCIFKAGDLFNILVIGSDLIPSSPAQAGVSGDPG